MSMLTMLERQLSECRKRCEELEKDARRYRWLRDRPSFIGWDWWNPPVPNETIISPQFMDAAIDAAMGAKP